MKSIEKAQLVKNIVSGSGRFEDRFIPEKSTLESVLKIMKQAGYKIVYTQGVYDLFHVGHKRYLEAAKSCGDILVVGVDTDELTRQRKGPNRPFDHLDDRLEILTALRTVDVVTLRRVGEDIRDFIKVIRPDVLIVSETTKDFTPHDKKNILKYCGEIKVLPAQASTSTSGKLRRMMVDGAEQLGRRITALIAEFLKGTNESSNTLSPGSSRRASGFLQKTKSRQSIRTRRNHNKRVSR